MLVVCTPTWSTYRCSAARFSCSFIMNSSYFFCFSSADVFCAASSLAEEEIIAERTVVRVEPLPEPSLVIGEWHRCLLCRFHYSSLGSTTL